MKRTRYWSVRWSTSNWCGRPFSHFTSTLVHQRSTWNDMWKTHWERARPRSVKLLRLVWMLLRAKANYKQERNLFWTRVSYSERLWRKDWVQGALQPVPRNAPVASASLEILCFDTVVSLLAPRLPWNGHCSAMTVALESASPLPRTNRGPNCKNSIF